MGGNVLRDMYSPSPIVDLNNHSMAPDLSSNMLDDVFGDDPDTTNGNGGSLTHEVSDIHRLRSLHTTNGYREGIANSKERHVQEGFDEGYSLGAVIGLRAGWILGICEGIDASFASSIADRSHSKQESQHASGRPLLLPVAREQLALERLFSREYFNEDGIWTFPVTGEEDGEVTFETVADHHPLIQQWTTTIHDQLRSLNIHVDTERLLNDDGGGHTILR